MLRNYVIKHKWRRFGRPLTPGYFFLLYRLIHIFCHKYSFVLFYIIVIRLEAWLLNYLKSSKMYKIKRKKILFTVNTKYMSSRELKTSKFSLVLRTRENYDVFNTLDDMYLVFTS